MYFPFDFVAKSENDFLLRKDMRNAALVNPPYKEALLA